MSCSILQRLHAKLNFDHYFAQLTVHIIFLEKAIMVVKISRLRTSPLLTIYLTEYLDWK